MGTVLRVHWWRYSVLPPKTYYLPLDCKHKGGGGGGEEGGGGGGGGRMGVVRSGEMINRWEELLPVEVRELRFPQ